MTPLSYESLVAPVGACDREKRDQRAGHGDQSDFHADLLLVVKGRGVFVRPARGPPLRLSCQIQRFHRIG